MPNRKAAGTAKLRSSFKPGTVVVLLAGQFRGRVRTSAAPALNYLAPSACHAWEFAATSHSGRGGRDERWHCWGRRLCVFALCAALCARVLAPLQLQSLCFVWSGVGCWCRPCKRVRHAFPQGRYGLAMCPSPITAFKFVEFGRFPTPALPPPPQPRTFLQRAIFLKQLPSGLLLVTGEWAATGKGAAV